MLKHIVLIILLVPMGGAVLAQRPQATAPDTALQKCLLGTFDDTWSALRLSDDQLNRIRLVQSACREECEVAGAHRTKDASSNANGSAVLAEVKNILTAEQYAAWVTFCSDGRETRGSGR
jgi:hypothetical protein